MIDLMGRTRFLVVGVLAAGGMLAAVACGEDATPTPRPPPPSVVATPTASVPTPTPAPQPKYGGVVNIAMGEPVGLGPYFKGRGGGEHNWIWAIHTNVVTNNADGVPDPSLSLAESWSVASDGLSVTMNLREGVLYHDGNEVTAQRVRSELLRAGMPGSRARGQVAAIESIDALSRYQFRINLSRPSAALLVNLGDRSGAVGSPEAVEQWGEDYGALMVVGSGAFRFKEWIEGRHIILERFAGYWRTDASGNSLPYVDQIITPFIPDANVRLAALRSGQVDIMSGPPPAEVAALRSDPAFVLHEKNGTSSSHVRLNLSVKPMDDVNLRRAMSYAINRQQIIDQVYFGLGEPTAVPLGSAHPWARHLELQESFGVTPNLEKARQYLAASGFENLEMDIMSNKNNATTAEVIQANMAEIGIKLNIELVSGSSVWFARQGPMYVTGGLSTRIDPHGMVFELHHPTGGYNAAGLGSDGVFEPDPELSRLLEDAEATYDLKERGDLYRKAAEIITLDAHAFYYRFGWAGWLVRNEVQGFRQTAEGKAWFSEVWRQS